jgi:hypothetical protein
MPSKRKDEDSDSDSESDDDAEDDRRDARASKGFDFVSSGKLAFYAFLVFVVLMSDVFIERVLAGSGIGLVEGRNPTKKGIVVQGVLLSLGLIALDFLISKEKL